MSKSEFLTNLITARNLFFHRVHTEGPPLDPKSVQAQLGRAAIWLTPSSVRGFNPGDFLELSPEARRELAQNVERFREIASQVAPTQPPTAEQTQEAMVCLLRVFELLAPYLPTGGELDQIKHALEQVQLPEAVLTLDFKLGEDSTGEPAVWVWVFVEPDAAARKGFDTLAADVPKKVRDALAKAGITRWAYVRFRTASEQRAL